MMRTTVIASCVMAAMLESRPGLAQSHRVTDEVIFDVGRQSLQHDTDRLELNGSIPRSVTTKWMRLVEPGAGLQTWVLTYEQVTSNGANVDGAVGRKYAIAHTGQSFDVAPIAPTDTDGLDAVKLDVESLRPVLLGEPLCSEESIPICSAMQSFVSRIGDATGFRTSASPLTYEVTVTAGGGYKFAGGATALGTSWLIQLRSTREDIIAFSREDKADAAKAALTATYKLSRSIELVTPKP